jgi:basic membrane protein A
MMRRSVLAIAAAAVIGLAGCGGDSADTGGSAADSGGDAAPAEGLKQETAARIAGVGISSPESNGWDRGGSKALTAAAGEIGAEPTWLSNVTYDQASQTFDRLVRQKTDIIVAHSSGYEGAILESAAKYPDNWFWIYSDLSATKDLPNVVGVKVNWNEFGYMLGAIACEISKTKKVGFVLAEPIPADSRSAGGAQQAAGEHCGDEKNLITTYIGTFEDVSKAKQAAEAMIAKGADVIFDVADAAALGAIEAAKAKPNVAYIGSVLNLAEEGVAPEEIVTSVYLDFESGYLAAAKLFKEGSLEPKIYDTDIASGGIKVADAANVPDAEALNAKIAKIMEDIKSGKIEVDPTREVKP